MKNKFLSVALLVFLQCAFGQEVYRLPFGSRDNTIDLSIQNSSNVTAKDLTVDVSGAPTWVKFAGTRLSISQLPPQQVHIVSFAFSIDKTAPVEKEQTVQFKVSTSDGQSWMKELKVTVAPPNHFELFQNYPNPFNPATVIEFSISKLAITKLQIVDLLGREVAVLVNEEKPAGTYKTTWDASNMPSGVYLVRMTANNPSTSSGQVFVETRKMLLVR
ncbi:MAG: T9SS type A sorting domain-containing protein [Ignavibacteriales bacterium]|nr:T9SS type A sorting domain-containing protein [Ignavibacteriales bacterium]